MTEQSQADLSSPGVQPAHKKDKEKVHDEVFTTDMLDFFLNQTDFEGDSADFRSLIFAFRGMPTQAYEAFLERFIQAGKNINALNAKGETALDVISVFKQHLEAAEVLKKQGAQKSKID